MSRVEPPLVPILGGAPMIRDARQLDRYGIAVCEPTRDYPRLLARCARSSAKWTRTPPRDGRSTRWA